MCLERAVRNVFVLRYGCALDLWKFWEGKRQCLRSGILHLVEYSIVPFPEILPRLSEDSRIVV